ncbi:MAG: helix-turn-helix domain-containing protein [Firmicutes bacterium]|nr:helix-turn-helix domain-containing protein [Bacillota bacterium]
MDNKIVGLRIASGRKVLGLSQSQFAQKVNVSQQAVGKWERGESLPDVFMLAKIGVVLGNTDICYFVGKDSCHCTCGCCDCCKE